MGKSSPKAPDPNKVAAEQNQWGLKTQYQNTAFNQMGQNTPWGSLSYSGDLPTFDDQGNMLTEGDRAANVTLSPSQQQAFDQNNQINRTLRGFGQNNLLPQVQQSLRNPLNFSNRQRPNFNSPGLQGQNQNSQSVTKSQGQPQPQPQQNQNQRPSVGSGKSGRGQQSPSDSSSRLFSNGSSPGLMSNFLGMRNAEGREKMSEGGKGGQTGQPGQPRQPRQPRQPTSPQQQAAAAAAESRPKAFRLWNIKSKSTGI